MDGDAQGLFGSSAAASTPAPGSPGAQTVKTAAGKARRDKLYNYDAAASVVLNPYGSSQFSDSSTETVWNMVSKGNKNVFFHSELAAQDDWRIGVGLSRTAETLLEGISTLEKDSMQKVLKPEILQRALDEANTLKHHLQVLNFGKGAEKSADLGGLAQLKRRKITQTAEVPTAEAVNAAVDAVREWLAKDSSPLRGMLSILAGGGAIWSAHVAEKVARSAVVHKPLNVEKMKQAALARRKEPSAASSSGATGTDDAHGLLVERGG